MSGAFLAALLISTPVAGAFAQTAPDAVALAVKDQADGKLKAVYAARGFWPLWVKNGALTPAAATLVSYLETADLDGLEPSDYDARALRELVERSRSGDAEALARTELRLSQAFARYVRDVRRAPNAQIRFLDEELRPKKLSEADVVRAAAVAPDFDRYLAEMGWMDPAYASLRRAMAERREHWSNLPGSYVAEGAALKPGMGGDRVAALRERLGLDPRGKFDKRVADELRAFQAAHGLKPDGVAGAGTIAALNRPPDWYDRKLAVNLDRARLLPGPGTRHIVVDIAAQQLVYFQEGTEAGRMRVVVGKPDQQTPMLAGMLRFAILNPYWNVPDDLAYKRVVSRVLNGASLQTLGFEALSGWDANAQLLQQDQVDWRAVADGRQHVRVRQLPGPGNAMGRVKFMFPNDLGIYLHDTNEPELMKRPARYFSSGCVRLEDAQRLGQWLFGQPLNPASDAPEQHVALPQPVPVYLTYLTVQATPEGVRFLDDVYARDQLDPGEFASR
ncbi:L,D-transpeptidase family protein [Sphingomonas sp. ID1715]|nr:L,D-transpeptidase family protein [Sphingomonas sp. ID1715]